MASWDFEAKSALCCSSGPLSKPDGPRTSPCHVHILLDQTGAVASPSLAASTDGPVTRRPHRTLHCCVHVGCDKSRQTSCTTAGGCGSQRRKCPRDRGSSPPGGLPGGEAMGEEEPPLGSVLPLILTGHAVRWEGGRPHPLHRGTNRLREAQRPAPTTQQWTRLASLRPLPEPQGARCLKMAVILLSSFHPDPHS